jgi:hypothetical protein
MVIAADFSGLRAWADALASILLLELIVLLLIVTALMFVLVMAARWLQMHVVPLLNTTVPAAKQALDATNDGTDRVVRGVAEVYGIRRAAETALQVMLFGPDATRGVATTRSAGVAPVSPPERPTAESPTAPPAASRPLPPAVERTPPDHDLGQMATNAG